MGMTIDNAIGLLERGSQYNYFDSAEDFCKAYDMAIDIMRKYQKLQADYENRLKADMVAMLEELDLEIDEIEILKSIAREDINWNMGAKAMREKIKQLIQERINALRGGENDI
jgi:hypothetical protein